MSYVTEQDLIDRFGEQELIDIAPDATGLAIDSVAVDRAVNDASGEVDGYIAAGGYDTPLTPVPAIVKAYTADIARYRLYDDHATEQVTQRYKDAIKFFTNLANGTVQLGVASPEPSGGSAEFNESRQVFKGGGF